MSVRPEEPRHYAAIADLHARAFGGRAGEASIVALLRQQQDFDPDLALVAEGSGRLVGHALFSPYVLRLLGEDVRAVNLAPVAVEPAYQGRGIGARLIEVGHEVAAAKGYSVSFLLGHPTYYPRFGYRKHAYGVARVEVPVTGLPPTDLEQRIVTADDVPALLSLWGRDEAAVDFALRPRSGLLDWISPDPAVESAVYISDGRIVGYTRINRGELEQPMAFHASDGKTAQLTAAALAERWKITAPTMLILPVHPSSLAATGFGNARVETWEAAMARSLGPSRLDDYFGAVGRGERPPGRPIWPVSFDLNWAQG